MLETADYKNFTLFDYFTKYNTFRIISPTVGGPVTNRKNTYRL